MTNEEKQIQLLEQIELNTKYTAKAMSFFKTLTLIGIIIGLFAFFIFLMATFSK